MPMPGLLEQSAPSDDSGDALFRQHREAAWAAHMPRYAKAVEAGNTTLAERIQDDVDAEASRRARLAAKRAPAASRASPEASRLAEIEQQLRGMMKLGGPALAESGPGYRKEAGGPLEVDIAPARLPRPDRAAVGEGPHGLPYLPPVAPPARTAEMRSSLSPDVDTVMEGLGLPTAVGRPLDMAYRIGSAGPRQVQTADRAIDKAIAEPSVGSIANAGTQTGMAALRPSIALPSLAVQYGNALAGDLGIFDGNDAQAQNLTRKQRREMEMERQRALRQADIDTRAAETASRLGREDADATQKRELAAEVERKERDEYDRAVKRAEDTRTAEEGKRRSFRDTLVGKVYDETGGAAPFALGAASGFVQRGLNPAVSQAKVLGWGAGAGAAASNLPSFADAYIVPPVENPDQRAASGYARELPPTHPRKAEWLAYAENEKLLPKLNPTRSVAKEEFTDTWPAIKRNIGGAVEGAVGAEIGMGAWGIPARLLSQAGQSLGILAKRPTPITSGVAAAPGIPGANAPSRPATAGEASSVPTQPALEGTVSRNALADRLPLYRQAVPSPTSEALPSRRAQSLPDPNYLAPHSTQLPPGRKFHSKPEPEPVKGHKWVENQTGFALFNNTTKQWASPPNMLKKLSKKGKADPDPAVEYLSKPGKLTKGM